MSDFCCVSVLSSVCSVFCLFCRVSVLSSVVSVVCLSCATCLSSVVCLLSRVCLSVCLLSRLSSVASVFCRVCLLSRVCLSRLSSVCLLSFVFLVSSVVWRLSLSSRLSSAMRIAVFHDGFDGVTHTAIRPHFPTWLFSKPLYRDSFRFYGTLPSFRHRPCRFAWSRVSFYVAMRIAVPINIIRKISSSMVHGFVRYAFMVRILKIPHGGIVRSLRYLFWI